MYPQLHIKETEKILIIAPHPDDETIGCGGILSLYGPQCDVLLLTDGRCGIPEGSTLTQNETAAIRKDEFVAAMRCFHVHGFQMLGIPDGELTTYVQAVSSVDVRHYDRIFVPNRNERHPDHKAAFEIIHAMCRRQKVRGELIEYEVWSPIISANRFLDISSIMEKKIAGLLNYGSQTASIDYEAFVKGLNMYRGAPHHVQYCEAFYFDEEQHAGLKRTLAEKLPKGLRQGLIRLKKRG